MACLIFPNTITAKDDSSYDVTAQITSKDDSEHDDSEHKETLDPEGRRIPPKHIPCIISSTNGVKISGLSEDILTYEIIDMQSGGYIASFSDELTFIDFLFSNPGEFIFKFETESYYIIGYISIS